MRNKIGILYEQKEWSDRSSSRADSFMNQFKMGIRKELQCFSRKELRNVVAICDPKSWKHKTLSYCTILYSQTLNYLINFNTGLNYIAAILGRRIKMEMVTWWSKKCVKVLILSNFAFTKPPISLNVTWRLHLMFNIITFDVNIFPKLFQYKDTVETKLYRRIYVNTHLFRALWLCSYSV